MISGIAIANIGIWRMVDIVEDRENDDAVSNPQMFSIVETMAPRGTKQRQSDAIAKYEEMEPDGPLSKMRKRGQILVITGFLIMLFGIFIYI
jgi:hypothetical protein